MQVQYEILRLNSVTYESNLVFYKLRFGTLREKMPTPQIAIPGYYYFLPSYVFVRYYRNLDSVKRS